MGLLVGGSMDGQRSKSAGALNIAYLCLETALLGITAPWLEKNISIFRSPCSVAIFIANRNE